MALTPEQIKGRIRNTAKKNHADARILIRIYMMERFLERVSVSPYKDKFTKTSHTEMVRKPLKTQ